MNSLGLGIKDILCTYRILLTSSSSFSTSLQPDKFARVVLNGNATTGCSDQDLISFYNKIFVSKLKKVAFEINNKLQPPPPQQQQQQQQSTPLTVSNSAQFITPVNGASSSQTTASYLGSTRNVDFSPRRMASSVFVSPSKLGSTTTAGQMQPTLVKPTNVEKFQVLLDENSLVKVGKNELKN